MLTLITYEARRKPRDDDGNETQQPNQRYLVWDESNIKRRNIF